MRASTQNSARPALLATALAAAVALAPAAGIAGDGADKCQKAWIHVGAIESDQCPPYDGPGLVPDGVPGGCIVMSFVGTLSGKWRLYYWYSEQHPEYNVATIRPPIWGSGGDAMIFYQLGVWETRRGRIYTETVEISHGNAVGQYPQPYAHFDHIVGGTGRFQAATGWISGAGDIDGALFGGQVCTPARGKPKK